MGNRTVLPSKLSTESFVYKFDMSSLLFLGESVGAGVVTCTVLIDGLPAPHMVSGEATVLNNVISQLITAGDVGVTYVLRVAATTNQGNVVITLANLSIISVDPYGN